LRIRDHRTSRRHKPAEDTSCPPVGRLGILRFRVQKRKRPNRRLAPEHRREPSAKTEHSREDRTASQQKWYRSPAGRSGPGARRCRFVTTAVTLRRRTELRRGRHRSCALCHAFSSHLGQIANL